MADRDQRDSDPDFGSAGGRCPWAVRHQAENARFPHYAGNDGDGAWIYLVDHRVVPITGLEDDFKYIGQGYLYDIIPIPVVICLVLAVLTYYLLRYTYIGRQIYASGGNVEAARYSGVNVDRRIILAYTISVVCAVIVGMIQAARLGLGIPARAKATSCWPLQHASWEATACWAVKGRSRASSSARC